MEHGAIGNEQSNCISTIPTTVFFSTRPSPEHAAAAAAVALPCTRCAGDSGRRQEFRIRQHHGQRAAAAVRGAQECAQGKLAILTAGKTQRQTAAETNLLSENRLSEIVRGWAEPRDDEKEALARVLNQQVAVLFEEMYQPAREDSREDRPSRGPR